MDVNAPESIDMKPAADRASRYVVHDEPPGRHLMDGAVQHGREAFFEYRTEDLLGFAKGVADQRGHRAFFQPTRR